MVPTEAVGNCVEHLESDLETTERPATEAFLEAGQDSKVGDLVRYSQYSRFMFLKIPFAFTEMHWNAVFAVNKGTWIISHSETSENELVWTDYSYLWARHIRFYNAKWKPFAPPPQRISDPAGCSYSCPAIPAILYIKLKKCQWKNMRDFGFDSCIPLLGYYIMHPFTWLVVRLKLSTRASFSRQVLEVW